MELEAAIGGARTGAVNRGAAPCPERSRRAGRRPGPGRGWVALLGGLAVLLGGAAARAQQGQGPGQVVVQQGTQLFARLPAEANSPEGITRNPATGEIIVGTFEPGGSNFLLRLDRAGQIVARLSTGRVPMLGLAFNERDQKVYITSTQPPRVLRVPASFDASTPIEQVASVPALPGGGGTIFPDAVAFRPASGELFISDARQGAIFAITDPSVAANVCPGRSDCLRILSRSPMLRSGSAIVPVGANGIEVSRAGDRLFVANTGSGALLSVRLDGNQEVTMLAAIRTPDGLTQPSDGTVAVTSSTGNQIVIFDATTGARRAVLGSATGAGALSMPASIVRSDNDLLVTNLGGRTPIVSRIPLPEALR